MIEQICDYIHNHFIRDSISGFLSINNGVLEQDESLLPGQYYMLTGSVFADGIHKQGELIKYDGANVTETFAGTLTRLAIPADLVALAGEIEDWLEKNGTVMDSPYQSESFGGYSYTKGAGADGKTSGADWRSVFGSRLNRWRKL